VQQNFADFFPGGSAARLARDGDGDAMCPQGTRQFLDLRALAAAIETFKRNELSPWRHAEIITGLRLGFWGRARRPGELQIEEVRLQK
jgi:hypothetical protein